MNRETFIAKFFISPKVVACPETEGSRFNDGAFRLGLRCGPTKDDITALMHEMSHFVEIDRRRMNKTGWGFKYGKYWECNGQSGYDPSTNQASKREARVFAIQYHLEKSIGLNRDVLTDYAPTFHYMGDCYYIANSYDSSQMEKTVTDWIHENIKLYSLEWFEHEWFDRLKKFRLPKRN